MAPEKDTYTNNQLNRRDQHIKDSHQKELDIVLAKNQRLRRNFDELSTTLFEERNRATRLAELLGYTEVFEALFKIEEFAEHGVTLRDYMQRVQTAEAQLEKERQEVENLQVRLRDIEQEKRQLKAEKRALEVKYDALTATKERAAERFRADYKKWKALKHWIFSDEPADKPPGMASEDRKKIKKGPASIQRKRQVLCDRELNPSQFEGELDNFEGAPIPPLGREEMESDKENQGTPMPPLKKRRVSTDPPAASPAHAPLRNALLSSINDIAPPSSSPTVFLDPAPSAKSRSASKSRVPLSFKPIADIINIKQEPSSTPSPLGSRNVKDVPSQPPISSEHVPGSSDTEDDSQAIFIPSKTTQLGKPVIFKVPAPPPTPGSSYWDERLRNPLHTSLPSRPSFAQMSGVIEAESSRQRSSIAEPMRASRDMSENTPSSTAHTRVNGLSSSVKGKERASEIGTPLASRNRGQKRIEDYSAFKGRGRYGKSDEAAQPTINAIYKIDPKNNGGLDFQYDEVVRRRDDRRKLDGGDCECCREYYQGIGTLPNRLQQPLWRSPTNSPSKPCLNRYPHSTHAAHSPNDHPNQDAGEAPSRHSEIEGHKKAISRHRQNWARAKTPPGYWNIGFPDTQEVGNINEKAREMHKRKKDEVDREAAAENGRYRRK